GVVWVLVFVVAAFAVSDLNITCEEKSVTVIWKLPNELGVQPSRLFLGKCLPTNFSSGPDGAVAMFHVSLTDCHFKRVVRGHKVLYKNKLTYRPLAKPFPPKLSFPVVCIYDRPPHWHPHMPILSSGSAIGFGSLLFYMGIMNDGKAGSSKFLPRDTKSEIFLSLQAFKLGAGEKVYIHCKITAWDPELLDENRKACNYIKELEGWELLDDPTQSDLCRCCDTSCSSWKRSAERDFRSLSQNAVLGPLTIEDVNLK
ncbi:zona pellucida sperm-binding protein 3-like, partial [Scleropages formosus]